MSENTPAASDTSAWQLTDTGKESYVLCLYITGTTPSSAKAVVNIRKLCEEHLAGRYDLEIVDISRDARRATERDIVAAPTLIKESPAPERRFIGDMSRTDRLLAGLGIVVA